MMKKWSICGLVAVLMAGLGPGAWAKPILVAETDKGSWYVIDRVFDKQGDCRLVSAVFVRREPLKLGFGLVKAITRVMQVCCQAETYRLTLSRFMNPEGKVIYTHQIPAPQSRAVTADPGSVMYRVIKKVCEPGFGED
jgi:hypothetical protein